MSANRHKLVREAQRLVARKKFSKAIDLYRKVVAANPKDVRTLLKIGDLYLKLDKHERALSTYEQVGEYYFREGFSVKAIAVYKQIRGIIQRHANHLTSRYGHIVPRLAEIYAQLGLTSDALAAYDEVAGQLRAQNREIDALEFFKKILDLDPQNPIAHLRVADSRARLGDLDPAIEGFGTSAQLMVKLGRHDDALKVLERLLQYREDPHWARVCAQLYLDRGDPTDGMTALSRLQISFKSDPKDLSTLAILARSFDTIGQPKKAVEVLKESARIAQEEKQHDAFEAILDTLLQRAPKDNGVQQLLQFRVARATGRPPPPTMDIDVDLNDLSIEESMSEVFELADGEIKTVGEDISSMDLFAPEITDDGNAINRVIEDANALLDAGRNQECLSALRNALHKFGDAIPIRERLIEVLNASGQREAATTETLHLATQLAAASNFEAALRHVAEVLQTAPENTQAVELRRQLTTELSGATPAVDLSQYHVRGAADEAALIAVDYVLERGPTVEAPQSHGFDINATPLAVNPTPPTQGNIDDALEHAEQLAQGGDLESARAVLEKELTGRPGHPLILSHLSDLAELERGSQPPWSGSGVGLVTPSSDYSPLPEGGQQWQGLADPETALATADGDTSANTSAPFADKLHARREIADDDYDTHYELAVGYREMGQIEDAIASLRIAAQDGQRECVCLYMVSQLQLQRGEEDAALDSLHAALRAQHRTRDEELTVGYEIGHIYQARDMPEQALQYFEWVAVVYPDHSDPRGAVTERIQRLRGGSGPLRLPLSRRDEADEA